MSTKGYSDLRVWSEAMALAKSVYSLTRAFPKEEIYGISQQMRRCAVSVASNIAEGSARQGTKEFLQFLSIAAGSLAELKTQLLIAMDVFTCPADAAKQLLLDIDRIGKMLTNLKKAVAVRKQPTTNNQKRAA